MRETEAMDVEAPLELIDRLSTSPGFVEWKKYGSRRAADVIYTGRGRDGTACMISYCSFAAGIVTLRLTTLSRSSVLLTLFALSLKKLRRDQRRPLVFLSNSSWIIPMYEVFSKLLPRNVSLLGRILLGSFELIRLIVEDPIARRKYVNVYL